MKLDVHKLFLNDAIEEIMMKFDECVELGFFTFLIFLKIINSQNFSLILCRNRISLIGTAVIHGFDRILKKE